MAVNAYFTNGSTAEQTLYEDLIIESIRIHGVNTYYCPRTIQKYNKVLNEDEVSVFEDATLIEAYIASVDGYEGDGTLMSKFGLEIRNQLKLVFSRRTWNRLVGINGRGFNSGRPSEGDLIYIPMAKGLFEIKFVELESPFYQLKQLPVYTVTCELFEYRSERIDTGVAAIDAFQSKFASGTKFDISYLYTLVPNEDGVIGRIMDDINGTEIRYNSASTPLTPFAVGDRVSLEFNAMVVGRAEVLKVISSTEIELGDVSYTDGDARTISTGWKLTNETTLTVAGITTTFGLGDGDAALFPNDPGAKNSTLETEAHSIIDFTEHNPFGEVDSL
jgi:hypothetical protein